jgi:hypothetical protein
MSTTPNTVTMNDELMKAIGASLDKESIRAAVMAEAEKQGIAAADLQAAADKVVADKATADAAATVETARFKRVETIGGREFAFEADSELELANIINNAYRVAYAVQTPEPQVVEPVVDPAVAAKAAEDAAVAKVELELKFKRGDISAADYIEQSGAMADYLAKQGVPLDALRNAVARNQDAAEEQSWEQATQIFLNSPAGETWPGGQKNLALIGTTLLALGLENATDKVAAYAQAYEQMKATGMIFPGEAEEAAALIVPAAVVVPAVVPAATVVAPVVPAVAPRTAATSSSMFGVSSGISGGTGASPAVVAAKTVVPADATPAEIMDAWKKSQVAEGKDPNAAFMDSFSGRR